jgi:hypothetical protein
MRLKRLLILYRKDFNLSAKEEKFERRKWIWVNNKSLRNC